MKRVGPEVKVEGSVADLWLVIHANIVGSNFKSAFTKSRIWVNRILQRMQHRRECLHLANRPHVIIMLSKHRSGACTRMLVRIIFQTVFWKPWQPMEQPGGRLSVNLRRDGSHRSRSKLLHLWLCLPPVPLRRIHYTRVVGGVKLTHDFCRSLKWLHG